LQLTIQDVHTKELLTFDFSRFIGEIGGDICKELPIIKANADILPGADFSVMVTCWLFFVVIQLFSVIS